MYRISLASKVPHPPAMYYNNRSGLLPQSVLDPTVRDAAMQLPQNIVYASSQMKILGSQLAFQF